MIVTTRGAFFFFFRFLNGTTSGPRGGPAYHRVVQCDAASRDSYFPFDSYPSRSRARLRYFIGVPTPVESLFNTTLLFSSLCAKTVLCAPLSSLSLYVPTRVFVVFSFFRKENDARGDLLNCRLKSSTFPTLHTYFVRSDRRIVESWKG